MLKGRQNHKNKHKNRKIVLLDLLHFRACCTRAASPNLFVVKDFRQIWQCSKRFHFFGKKFGAYLDFL